MDAAVVQGWAQLIISVAVTAVLIPLGIYFARYTWDRRRWHAFERLLRIWAREEALSDDLTEEEWDVLVAIKLSEAGFEPARISELSGTAVRFARGRASQEMRGRIQLGAKGEGHGEPNEPDEPVR